MHDQFQPNAAAMLIGSQPLKEHKEANRLVLEYTPDIPNWVQLPAYRNEGMVDQFVDRTKRDFEHTFFGGGIVAHVAFAHPVSENLRKLLVNSARASKARVHDGGIYVNMEGPAFSTRAESLTNHRAGYDVIGMTNLGEARCAREAEIAYATMAMVTDYDSWKEDGEHVTVEMVIELLHQNAETAKKIVRKVIPQIPTKADWPEHSALANAILTNPALWPAKRRTDLKPILAKYL